MKYFYLEPEVAGGLGKGTIMDVSTHPPRVSKLVYELSGWPDDAILEIFPCWIVTTAAQKEIQSAGLTGVMFDHVDIVFHDQFKDFYPDAKLPEFVWMKVDGTPGHDDFGVRRGVERSEAAQQSFPRHAFDLVVSERALDVLKPLGTSNAEITPSRPDEAVDDQGGGN